jgi:NAD(P)-dependent dehydrogenase (short-subunit alcohol dehydrogenase family)
MQKDLLIFGAYGALGSGITEVMIQKDYDKLYLFDFKIGGKAIRKENIINVDIEDLSIEENVIKAFQSVIINKEKYYFLFSTVGGFSGGKNLWETESVELDKMINMNLKSSFFIAKHFSKIVKECKGGSLCFTAALTGIQPEKKKAAYGIAKSGLVHLVKTLSLEAEKINMTVNGIAPYVIDTPANREWMKNSSYDEWVKPEELGELAHSLFSNFYFITGNIITITFRFSPDL